MEAAAAQKQKAVDLSQQQNTYVNTTVEDLGVAYFAENPLYRVNLKTDLSQFEFGSSTNSGFTINQDIMNGVGMPSIVHSDYQLDSGLASGNGLTLKQVRKASLQMITHWDQPLMLPAYDPNFELTGGAKLMPTSAVNQAYQRDLLDRQQAFFGGGRPEAWHMPVSQGITDAALNGSLAFRAGQIGFAGLSVADSLSSIQSTDLGQFVHGDYRFGFGVSNDDLQFDIKIYGGSDGYGFSYKSGLLGYKGAVKSNVSQHIRWENFTDIGDDNTGSYSAIAEYDTLKPTLTG